MLVKKSQGPLPGLLRGLGVVAGAGGVGEGVVGAFVDVDGGVFAELAEQLHFRLYEALQWLRSRGLSTTSEPLPSLEKAYRELFRKASHLEPELRHHFLFQISEYRNILEAAARAGLTTDLTG